MEVYIDGRMTDEFIRHVEKSAIECLFFSEEIDEKEREKLDLWEMQKIMLKNYKKLMGVANNTIFIISELKALRRKELKP